MIVIATMIPSTKQNDTANSVLASFEPRTGSEPRRQVLSGNLTAREYASVFTPAEFMIAQILSLAMSSHSIVHCKEIAERREIYVLRCIHKCTLGIFNCHVATVTGKYVRMERRTAQLIFRRLHRSHHLGLSCIVHA
jgi:hypothetical protein